MKKPPSERRTASAGWYNTAAFEQQAEQAGIYAKSINGDAFSDEIKKQTIDLINKDWGGEIDLVIYSLASPRRTDPKTGETYHSTLKPIGDSYSNKTVDVVKGIVSEISIDPANDEDIANTTKVMGGEDWQLWIEALVEANVLSEDAMTIAYSYVGPQLTYPIYRAGTIGKAKEDLENTAGTITDNGVNAYISVNKGLVTQASSAIPVVPLYFSLLFKIMKQQGTHEGCIEQIQRLFAQRLYCGGSIPVDDENRIRIDDLEMDNEIQQQVAQLWNEVTSEKSRTNI